MVGFFVGTNESIADGFSDGTLSNVKGGVSGVAMVGFFIGTSEGIADGFSDGCQDGVVDGFIDGSEEGDSLEKLGQTSLASGQMRVRGITPGPTITFSF